MYSSSNRKTRNIYYAVHKTKKKGERKAWGEVTLPSSCVMLGSGSVTFVSYAMFGCHNSASGKNFDAGIQIVGKDGNNIQFKLILNGGGALVPPSWHESQVYTAAPSAYSNLTVELIYETAVKGIAKVSYLNHDFSVYFADNMWQNKFQNGVQFWKEMTIASSLTKFIDLWSSANIGNTQKVYMSNLTFKEVKLLRHSGGTTQYSLDSNCTTTTGTPKLDPQTTGSMPTWQQMKYGGTPTSGSTNLFSIDCRP